MLVCQRVGRGLESALPYQERRGWAQDSQTSSACSLDASAQVQANSLLLYLYLYPLSADLSSLSTSNSLNSVSLRERPAALLEGDCLLKP